MCLITKKLTASRADRDIECYKFVRKTEDGYFITAFLDSVISDDKNRTDLCGHRQVEVFAQQAIQRCGYVHFNEQGIPFFSIVEEDDNDEQIGIVEEGYIHTFQTIEDMLKSNILSATNLENMHHLMCTLRIYRCVIPEGAHYFAGISYGGGSEDKYNSYASTEIEYVEDITEQVIDDVKIAIVPEYETKE